jgi:hypothetical protein
MHVNDYAKEGNTRTGESDWLDLADVEIPSGEMAIADPSLYPDGLVVPVRPGRYHIQVVIRIDSESRTISRLRAYTCENHVVGGGVGEVGVDFARLGIGDNPHIAGVAGAITPEMAEPIWQSLETNDLFGIVPWSVESGVAMPFVIPGDGDGNYAVRELLNGNSRVGIQIDFFQ